MKNFLRRAVSLMAAVVLVSVSSGIGAFGGTVAAEQGTSYVAKVILTLPDQSKLVQPQADVPIVLDAAPSPGELNVRVDPSKTYQTMEGVGAALTESSAYLLSEKLTAAQRSLVFPVLFSKQYGAGMDVVRVPWGVTDFALGEYTYNDNPAGGTDASQTHFSAAHDQQYMIPMLKAAQTANPGLKMFFAPWTPPAWMKTPAFPSDPLSFGTLKPEFYGSYATYLAKAINSYTAEGLWPTAFTPQNEPATLTVNYTTYMDPATQATLIGDHIGPKVQTHTMAKPKILSHDEDWQDERDTASPMYALSTLSDTEAAAHTKGVAYHCYNGESTKQLLVKKAHPNKEIHVTECTGSITPPEQWDDDFRWGMRNMIINPIRNYAQTSMYWNLALDENNGPYTNTDRGCHTCRGVMTITNAGAVSLNNEYYILAQYGKFVNPGAKRIDSTTFGEGSIETVAFKNPDGKRAMIALNSGATARDFVVREGNAAFRYSLPAGAAATFSWDMPVNSAEATQDTGHIQAEGYASSVPANLPSQNITDSGRSGKMVRLINDQSLTFDNVAFQAGKANFQMRYYSWVSGTVEIRQNDANGPLLASIPFTGSDWKTTDVVTGAVAAQAGTHSLHVTLKHPSNSFVDINWLKFDQSPVTANPIAGKSNWSAYGVFSGGTDVAANILDSNNASRWTTGYPMTYGHWLTIDTGKLHAMNKLGAYSQAGDRPGKLKIEVSDDGINYETVKDNYVPPADLYLIEFDKKVIGRYVRITELSENNPSNWWSMNEINLYND